jgi:two-component system chemotaxis response regulator CheB
MPKIRILVVDDAVVFRRLVSDELNKDPALEVVGTAANGQIAIARMSQLNPDVVILDVEMPEMDGLTALKELRKTYPRLPIIMFSALTERGANATIEALSLGASDYFAKPSGLGGMDASLEVIRKELIPEIKALHAAAVQRATLPPKPRTMSPEFVRPNVPEIQVVAIGTSTGGPNALAEVFTKLPADFPVPIVMVQHMPPLFTKTLAERLTAQSPIRVEEGANGVVLQSGRAWIAPGDYHMTVVRDGVQKRLALNQGPPENSCRPAADVLFRSVAQAYGPNVLAVVLTGMGQDGLHGCRTVREAKGQIIVQDEASSVVWGMPGAVFRAGLADRVLPISQIADEIVRRVKLKIPSKA